MDALACLRLQMEWGADEALGDAPVSRLRLLAAAEGASLPERAEVPRRPVAVPVAIPRGGERGGDRDTDRGADRGTDRGAGSGIGTAAAAADAAVSAAGDLDALRAAIAGFENCALRDTATSTVLPEGNAAPGILLLGEVPDADEDRAGHPFAGRSGALLDRMLRSIGLDRSGVLLAPLIPWRPPGGRPPSPRELAQCRPMLDRLFALARPRFVLLLGSRPAREVLGVTPRAGAGWRDRPANSVLPDGARLLATRHPGTLLGHPAWRKDAWGDLVRLRVALDATGTGISITDA